MSWLSDLDRWFEQRRVMRRPDMDLFYAIEQKKTEAIAIIIKGLENKIEVLEVEKQVPSTTLKEFNMLKVRLERIELLVGLKREPVVSNLPDAPRIS